MIFILDNYDSFTYNIVQYAGEFTPNLHIARNDKIAVQEVLQMQPKGIIISPGPKTPKEAGISCDLIQAAAGKVPILGVCLGHQAIGEVFGANVIRAPEIKHGKTSTIRHFSSAIFQGIPEEFSATRYHSLIVDRETLPKNLRITAETSDGLIMALEHAELSHVYGVQFHPESILTPEGLKIIQNFIRLCN
ncbi:MAG: aminodeoxychorismate/anthranilate synthase component II [Candidatus Hydrogenedentota bacterium]|nr:MAG: aminodeoxychorismate/anthranilate synthase component II [Candidatus Hydrogenedentota bacterium]